MHVYNIYQVIMLYTHIMLYVNYFSIKYFKEIPSCMYDKYIDNSNFSRNELLFLNIIYEPYMTIFCCSASILTFPIEISDQTSHTKQHNPL